MAHETVHVCLCANKNLSQADKFDKSHLHMFLYIHSDPTGNFFYLKLSFYFAEYKQFEFNFILN